MVSALEPRWDSPLVDVVIWAFAIGAIGLTFWYSLAAAPPGQGSDRQLHAFAYFVDTLAILLAVVWRPGRRGDRVAGKTVVVAVGLLGLGGLLEIAQSRFVDRAAQFTDWMADAAGIGLAVVVFALLRTLSRVRAN